MKIKSKIDFVVALLLLGVSWLAVVGTTDISNVTQRIEMMGPAFLPRLMAAFIAVCAILLMGMSFISKEPTQLQQPLSQVKNLLPVALGMLAFIYVIKYLGFILTTLVFMAGFQLFLGERNWVKLGTISLAFSMVIYYIFTVFLRVQFT
ncbi:tripartite tricarboxylate transporter TctB family protein [Neomoorella mulderi]|uniref:Tripartite tricarboxylate transporter TctB family protein n=1 Tax=Moorella mulderi DSM 14980 TaxID=1122241 RepID=A0A151ASL1_9FIRM|nr:tripartite tricarboxylate transporter TctB family protein [Moorella mulderi]KYH30563.1 tripartite tricarboxylate transporter TctB family protein [Moorella mulderi DSM 14980]